MKKILLILILAVFTLGCKFKNEKASPKAETTTTSVQFSKQLGYVSDFEKTLTEKEIEDLTKKLSDYEKQTSNQIAIVSISDNLTENNFDQYAIDLSNHWKIGTSENNNGLTIIYSKKLRKVKISTGTGAEKILTNEICEKVLNEKIIPEFKNGNYYQGLDNAVTEFITMWK
ncbi:YgcG family protein [Soonwooa sp.]|uniref:TPM domain-containing protein n=1 Tax=Soonwooa sp. TaxID=1938592 RepID=UPI002631B21D|nr:TPM domain-containing protein [Soonwooa sp.]